MKKSKIGSDSLLRSALITLVLFVLIFYVYLRFKNPEIIYNLVTDVFEYNPFLSFILLLILIPIYILISLRLIRYGKNRSGLVGRFLSASMALRLGIVSVFITLVFFLFILWALAKLLQ